MACQQGTPIDKLCFQFVDAVIFTFCLFSYFTTDTIGFELLTFSAPKLTQAKQTGMHSITVIIYCKL